MSEISSIIFGCICVVIGVFLFIKTVHKHKKIDSQSVAVVSEVRDLGRSDGARAYAILHSVQSEDPFEIWETPCKKEKRIGYEQIILYEKENPCQNYYFKTIGNFDKRFVPALFFIVGGLILLVLSIITMF